MENAPKDLSHLRAEIDQVDRALIQTLGARFSLIEQISRLKAQEGSGLRDPQREADLLSSLTAEARDAGLDEHFVDRLFREILDHSVRTQYDRVRARHTAADVPLRVAYQGTEGAYSYVGATRHFGPMRSAEKAFQGFRTFREAAEAVRGGSADFACLPIENTIAGSIAEVYDLLTELDLTLVGEEVLAIEHCLLGLEGTAVHEVREVLSHPKALEQCTRFVASIHGCRARAFDDTAMAAQYVAALGDRGSAAIASEMAAQRFGLSVLARDIADARANFTRFLIVGREPHEVDPGIPCKTSIVFAVQHAHGALAACLGILSDAGLNLTKIESRPRPQSPWKYLMYGEFEGHAAAPEVAGALRRLTAHTQWFKVLGCFPAHMGESVTRARYQPPPRAGARRMEKPLVDAQPGTDHRLVSRATRHHDTEVLFGDTAVGGVRPVVIAGPCSVESEDQIRRCAGAAREAGAHALRGGCFKPRTSPYAFQGLGWEGLELLAAAGHEVGLPVVTEVLHPGDVAGVARLADVLQVGARNMQNFELLKALGGVDRPVLLKRGMSSSIDEWLSAAEYILAHGNQQVVLCERGIRTFETATRNTLDLSAVPIVRERTHLPVIVDPSHACGVARWVPALVHAALAAGSHGVMVEIHPEPERALSDGPQSLDLDAFSDLMAELADARVPQGRK